MRIVIALGGNALLQRGQPMTAENQRANIRLAAERIAAIAAGQRDRHRARQRPAGRAAGLAGRGVHGRRAVSRSTCSARRPRR